MLLLLSATADDGMWVAADVPPTANQTTAVLDLRHN